MTREKSERVASWVLDHWKTVLAVIGFIITATASGVTFMIKVENNDKRVEKIEAEQKETTKLLVGQQEINKGQERTNNLLVDMIREVRRERWAKAPSYGPQQYETRRMGE